jgi:hypothetical protein
VRARQVLLRRRRGHAARGALGPLVLLEPLERRADPRIAAREHRDQLVTAPGECLDLGRAGVNAGGALALEALRRLRDATATAELRLSSVRSLDIALCFSHPAAGVGGTARDILVTVRR